MATRYVPGASSIEIPLRDTDEVSQPVLRVVDLEWREVSLFIAHLSHVAAGLSLVFPRYSGWMDESLVL